MTSVSTGRYQHYLSSLKEQRERMMALPFPAGSEEFVGRVRAWMEEAEATDPDELSLDVFEWGDHPQDVNDAEGRDKMDWWRNQSQFRLTDIKRKYAEDFKAGANDSPRLWSEMAIEIGLPRKLIAASFTGCEETAATERGKRYAESDAKQGRCLVLMGQTGCGKSFVAASILRVLRNPATRFVYFPQLCARILDPIRREDALEEWGLLDRHSVERDPVVWDDFGTEYLKAGGMLEGIIDELFWLREAEELPTIITTNLTPEAFKERVSDRIVDRLRGGWGEMFAITGGSFRGR